MNLKQSFTHIKVYRYFPSIVLILIELFLVINFLRGISSVPFHPDESTQLFMSRDFELLFTQPSSMGWKPGQENDIRQHYRELDAPLTRYLLGFGRYIAGIPALPVDWDWSRTWQENQQRGALPDNELLITGRWSISILLLFSLLLLYLAGRKIYGRFTGFCATVFLSLNALILLHDRRAMAEGALTMGVTFAMWSFLLGYEYPWLAGLGLAIAYNAKQSSLILLPVGILSVCWIPDRAKQRFGRVIGNVCQLICVFFLITLLLNPLFWKNPIQAIMSSMNARQDLMQRQVADVARLAPGQYLNTPIKRSAILIANLYFVQPSFAEVGNYTQDTSQSENKYLQIPGQNLLRNTWGGILLFTLTLVGIIDTLRRVAIKRREQQRILLLFIFSTIALIFVALFIVPLPWQRYVIPLIPFNCILQAYAVSQLVNSFTGYTKKSPPERRGSKEITLI
jgi:hypothetical protein